jgi:hypothetical protein
MSEPADLRIWYHYLTGIDTVRAGLIPARYSHGGVQPQGIAPTV